MHRGEEREGPGKGKRRTPILLPDFLLSALVVRLDGKDRIVELLSEGDGRLERLVDAMERGKRLDGLFDESSGASLRDAVSRCRCTGKEERVSLRMDVAWESCCFEARIAPDPSRPTSLLVALQDRTDRQRTEDYAQLIRKIFADATEAILLLPVRGDFAQFNESFCRMFGIECVEKLGNRLEEYAEFFSPVSFGKILERVERQGDYRGEVTLHRPDGSTLAAWLSVDTVYDREDREVFRILMLTDISELQESREMLRFTATHDALTGLPNRRMLMNQLDRAVQRSLQNRHSGAVFFIDLDNFKDINDTMGHVAGDAVLIECASRIASVIRKNDTFGRLGGDEFLLITERIESPEALMQVAQKILAALNRPFQIGDLRHEIGASIGVAIFPHDSKNRDELLQFADMAMYRAKEQGKNRYQFYSSGLDEKVRRHFTIEKALRYALENDGFYLVFQPQIDLDSEVVVGLEVLLRIDDRIAGPLDPQEFIPIAEESDLILKIGRWVLTRCCQTLYRWRERPVLDGLDISINLSRRQLMDDSWADFVERTLKRYGIDPGRIEFEITETAFMQSERAGLRTIRRLHDLGCRISIDDFGTGYSSLSTLREFTIDKLKIDKSFIDDITRNSTDRTIVKASIAMAHAMGLTTIAEGVETDEQKRIIKLMGCKEMQGFLFSEPKEAHEILALLERQKRGREE